MADEFAKGLGILTTAGLAWMILAGWYNTPSFHDPQLISPDPTNVGVYGEMALLVKDVLLWTAILGALAFWVVIPLAQAVRAEVAGE